jgi:membrane protease YdiL (CAAX protease family)
MNNKSAGKGTDWNPLMAGLMAIFMFILHGIAVAVVVMAVEAGERVALEQSGKIVVSQDFLQSVVTWNETEHGIYPGDPKGYAPPYPPYFEGEAKKIVREEGGSEPVVAARLQAAVEAHGSRDLATMPEFSEILPSMGGFGRIPGAVGSLVLVWWLVMLVCQGEGLEMDLQRRRHPMWEWLFSHPVPPGAVFLAELLAPIAGNSVYWGAPLFPAILYGLTYGFGCGALAALLVGVPVTVAAACAGKALEIAITLRVAPRSRGALIGIMSWLGYASLMLFFLGLTLIPKVVHAAAPLLALLARVPWPWLGVFLGIGHGGASFPLGVATCLVGSVVLIAASVWFSVWGAEQGLAGNFASDSKPARAANAGAKFGREPLYRKEILWFVRDRSAIVQTILVPITLASVQAFNLRGLMVHAIGKWTYLSGTAILFGTYFLWVLGPKSLASEGTALWIALTWPRGLESLLKAKAWLWTLISSGFVALILVAALWMYPGAWWKIAFVALGWWFFGRSMAEKTVTMVTITSESGEVGKVPKGLRWGASLGMATFAVGIMTEQWPLAVVGIVYSYLTAAAMWQNFRARLPYLYDPWSEVLPDPPTLMHAMIAISVMVEVVAMLTGIGSAWFGRDSIGPVQAISYGLCAVIVAFAVSQFLENRNVWPEDILCWKPQHEDGAEPMRWWRIIGLSDRTGLTALAAGVAGGLGLGLFALGYTLVLHHIPLVAEELRVAEQQVNAIPDLRFWYAIMAIGFAPLAEEYLFRGLLYRALDREWGGWRAVMGAAAFFAIYHPVTSWLPVGLMGGASALLFKRTKRLAPCVLLHMAYNAVVILR